MVLKTKSLGFEIPNFLLTGPECYKVVDICNPSPCTNGGVCEKTGPHLQQFVCMCPQYHYGEVCAERNSSCEVTANRLSRKTSDFSYGKAEICLNGGICVDHPTEFAHSCQCLGGWKGEFCEIADVSAFLRNSHQI